MVTTEKKEMRLWVTILLGPMLSSGVFLGILTLCEINLLPFK